MGRGLLPPWDQQGYFQKWQNATFTSGGPLIKLASADPMRILIVFASMVPGSQWFISPDPKSGTGSYGIPVNNAGLPIVINWSWWGPLAQSEWWGFCTAAGPIYVLTQALKTWPTQEEGSLSD